MRVQRASAIADRFGRIHTKFHTTSSIRSFYPASKDQKNVANTFYSSQVQPIFTKHDQKRTSQGQQVLTETRPKTMCSHPGYKVIHLTLHIMSSPIILQFGGGNTYIDWKTYVVIRRSCAAVQLFCFVFFCCFDFGFNVCFLHFFNYRSSFNILHTTLWNISNTFDF